MELESGVKSLPVWAEAEPVQYSESDSCNTHRSSGRLKAMCLRRQHRSMLVDAISPNVSVICESDVMVDGIDGQVVYTTEVPAEIAFV